MICECPARIALWFAFSSVTWAGELSIIPPVVTEPACCAGSSRAAALSMDLLADEKAWKLGDPAAWQWLPATKEMHLKQQSAYKPTFRSPVNLAWFESREWSSFSLTMECQLTSWNEGNNDLCIAFGGQGADRFYYAHLGEKADQPHHQIHRVDRADRKPITTYRTGGTPWKKDTWHNIKVVRNAETGDIAVWFDGNPQPLLTARDLTWSWGKIGIGSFDDTGRFRHIRIRGTSRATSSDPSQQP